MISHAGVDSWGVFGATVDIAMAGYSPKLDGFTHSGQRTTGVTPTGVDALFTTGTDHVLRDIIVLVDLLASLPIPVR